MNTTLDFVCIGLDVSKDTFDACLLKAGKRHEKQFANDEKGHAKLLGWAHTLAVDSHHLSLLAGTSDL